MTASKVGGETRKLSSRETIVFFESEEFSATLDKSDARQKVGKCCQQRFRESDVEGAWGFRLLASLATDNLPVKAEQLQITI